MGPSNRSRRSISSAEQNPADDGLAESLRPGPRTIKKGRLNENTRWDEPFHFEIAHGWAGIEILATAWADEG